MAERPIEELQAGNAFRDSLVPRADFTRGMSKDRIVELQRSLKIARQALRGIRDGYRNPEALAADALDIMFRLEKKQPLQNIVGHERAVRR